MTVSKHLIINGTVFLLQNICKYIWLSPDGNSAGDKWISEFEEGYQLEELERIASEVEEVIHCYL